MDTYKLAQTNLVTGTNLKMIWAKIEFNRYPDILKPYKIPQAPSHITYSKNLAYLFDDLVPKLIR